MSGVKGLHPHPFGRRRSLLSAKIYSTVLSSGGTFKFLDKKLQPPPSPIPSVRFDFEHNNCKQNNVRSIKGWKRSQPQTSRNTYQTFLMLLHLKMFKSNAKSGGCNCNMKRSKVVLVPCYINHNYD